MAATALSIQTVIGDAVAPVVERVCRSLSRAIAAAEAREKRKAGPGRRRSRRSSRTEITRWVPDRQARRVPTFVIEATGLDTKKRIVAKYGTTALFRKGKPLPKALR